MSPAKHASAPVNRSEAERKLRAAIRSALQSRLNVQRIVDDECAKHKPPTIRAAVRQCIDDGVDDCYWCNHLEDPLASAHVGNRINTDAYRENRAMHNAEYWRSRGHSPADRNFDL